MSWFAVTGITFARTPVDVTITLTTNNPFHLWLRQTIKQPGKHIVADRRRGGFLPGDFRLCFVEFTDLEQREVGDTLSHSWKIATWVETSWHWFYCFGCLALVFSACTSTIYEYFYGCFYRHFYLEPWDWLGHFQPNYKFFYKETWSV